MNSIRRHLTYANVVATLALVFAMSGSAIAAKHYLITSTNQIKPSVLAKLRASAKPGAAGPGGAQGLPGPRGPAGLTGAEGTGKEGLKGLPGTSGVSGYEVVLGDEMTSNGGSDNAAFSAATCAAGKSVIGGGFTTTDGGVAKPEAAKPFAIEDIPQGSTGWQAETFAPNTTAYVLQAYAICAKVSS